MAQVTLVFRDLLVYSQEHGTDDDHLVSVATYEIRVDDKSRGVYQSLVRQTPGAGLEEPLEITVPETYAGPMNYEALRIGVENYYRQALGQQGRAVNFGPGTSITIRNMSIGLDMRHSFDAP